MPILKPLRTLPHGATPLMRIAKLTSHDHCENTGSLHNITLVSEPSGTTLVKLTSPDIVKTQRV